MSIKPPWKFETPNCRGEDTTGFYTEDDGLETTKEQKKEIKKICGGCVHQLDCLEWGLEKERFGVWGGLNNRERSLLRRRRRNKALLV
jgi:hypothetical protein